MNNTNNKITEKKIKEIYPIGLQQSRIGSFGATEKDVGILILSLFYITKKFTVSLVNI